MREKEKNKLVELLAPTSLSLEYGNILAIYLADNGVAVPIHCRDCRHWQHTENGYGDCSNRRFHLDYHADPTMDADDFCSLGERRSNNELP